MFQQELGKNEGVIFPIKCTIKAEANLKVTLQIFVHEG